MGEMGDEEREQQQGGWGRKRCTARGRRGKRLKRAHPGPLERAEDFGMGTLSSRGVPTWEGEEDSL